MWGRNIMQMGRHVVIVNKMYSQLQKLVRIWQNCNLLPFRQNMTRQDRARREAAEMTILRHSHRWNIPRKALNMRLDGTHGQCVASVAKRTSIPWSSTLYSGHSTDSGMRTVQVQSPPTNVVSTYIDPQLTSFVPDTGNGYVRCWRCLPVAELPR